MLVKTYIALRDMYPLAVLPDLRISVVAPPRVSMTTRALLTPSIKHERHQTSVHFAHPTIKSSLDMAHEHRCFSLARHTTAQQNALTKAKKATYLQAVDS